MAVELLTLSPVDAGEAVLLADAGTVVAAVTVAGGESVGGVTPLAMAVAFAFSKEPSSLRKSFTAWARACCSASVRTSFTFA